MATSYPSGLDALTNPTSTDALNSVTVPHATQHTNANDAIEAIQAELGLNPKGSAATVAARLATLASSTSPAIAASITTASTSFDLVNTAATTVNFASAATALSMGASTGTLSVGNLTFTLTNATTVNNTQVTAYNVSTAPTVAVSLALGTGVTASGATKTLNLGTAGASGSTTNITLGSATTGALGTTTVNQNLTYKNLIATAATAPTIASAATIAPTAPIVLISGTVAIVTITAPSPISAGGGQIVLLPTGIFTTTVAGNIALASTAVVGKALIMTYNSGTSKWYPSY